MTRPCALSVKSCCPSANSCYLLVLYTQLFLHFIQLHLHSAQNSTLLSTHYICTRFIPSHEYRDSDGVHDSLAVLMHGSLALARQELMSWSAAACQWGYTARGVIKDFRDE